MNKKRVFTSLAGAVLLSAGLVGTMQAVNPDFGTQTVQAARYKKLRVLPFKQTKYQFVMKSNHAVYNSKGKRLNIATIKKGRQVNAKGIKTIKGKKYADLGYGQFVKIAGTKATMWQGSNPTSSNTNTNTSTNTGKNTSSNSSNSSTKTPSKSNGVQKDENGKSYVNGIPDWSGSNRNYLTNNIDNVKRLALQKINEYRTQYEWYSHPELHEKLQPYQTDPEIQRLADVRAQETAQTGLVLGHTRPNGAFMDMSEFRKELPNLGSRFKLGRFSTAGEDLVQINAQATDEETAAEIARVWYTETTNGHNGHKAILISEDARVGIAAVGLSFSPEDGFYCSFEMVGANYWADEK